MPVHLVSLSFPPSHSSPLHDLDSDAYLVESSQKISSLALIDLLFPVARRIGRHLSSAHVVGCLVLTSSTLSVYSS